MKLIYHRNRDTELNLAEEITYFLYLCLNARMDQDFTVVCKNKESCHNAFVSLCIILFILLACLLALPYYFSAKIFNTVVKMYMYSDVDHTENCFLHQECYPQ